MMRKGDGALSKRRKFAGLCIACFTFATAAQAAGNPPTGVYGCYDVKMDYKMQMMITPMPFVMFGLVDDSTYSDWDGKHGHYRYDSSTGVITMIDGSRQGWRYAQTGTWAFTLIDNQTGKKIYTCPFDGSKNPAKGPW